MRETDLVARLGGDEFMVLLEKISHEEDAGRIADKIVRALSSPFELQQSEKKEEREGRKKKYENVKAEIKTPMEKLIEYFYFTK